MSKGTWVVAGWVALGAFGLAGCGDSGDQAKKEPTTVETPVRTDPPAEPASKPEPVTSAPAEVPAKTPPPVSPPARSQAAVSNGGPPFELPPGGEELQAGLKNSDSDLVEQGLAVLTGQDVSSLALKVVALAVLKRPKELDDAVSALRNAVPVTVYETALVKIAEAAALATKSHDKAATTRALQDATKPLEPLSGCAIAYYASARIASDLGDTELAKAFSIQAARRES
jgi:hypothetical protein